MSINIQDIQKAAEQGDRIAQYNLAVWHINGHQGVCDVDRAIEWLNASVDQDFRPAHLLLGELYLKGMGVGYDPKLASEHIQKAACDGYADAWYRLAELNVAGLGLPADPEQARILFMQAANQGHAGAQYQLAYCLEHGIGGVENIQDAVAWYFRAATSSPGAQATIGRKYETGNGLPENPVKAMAWYTKALGNAFASVESSLRSLRKTIADADVARAEKLATTDIPVDTFIPGSYREQRPPAPEIISWEPRIVSYPGFLHPEECWHLIELARTKIKPSTVAQRVSGEISENQGRLSGDMQIIPSRMDAITTNIEKRFADYSLLPSCNGEAINILRYDKGGEYVPHRDYFDPEVPEFREQIQSVGQRIATFLVYLNKVEDGGETSFPEIGVTVKPQEGSGLLFFNCTPDGNVDPLTLHRGCPVKSGVKWLASKWIREHRVTREP